MRTAQRSARRLHVARACQCQLTHTSSCCTARWWVRHSGKPWPSACVCAVNPPTRHVCPRLRTATRHSGWPMRRALPADCRRQARSFLPRTVLLAYCCQQSDDCNAIDATPHRCRAICSWIAICRATAPRGPNFGTTRPPPVHFANALRLARRRMRLSATVRALPERSPNRRSAALALAQVAGAAPRTDQPRG